MLYEENISLVINSLFEKKKQYSKMININDEVKIGEKWVSVRDLIKDYNV